MKVRAAPPQAYFVGSAVFHYLGPAFAVLLFARVDPIGVAWLRIASAGAIFAVWRRPWRALHGIGAATWRLLLALGVVLAVMNSCFYVAIDRLPLGTVAAIEFLPVIALAAIGTRSGRNALALGLAVSGVYLLTDVRLEGEPVGVAFAFANAGLFALYIVLAHRVSRSPDIARIDGLAAAMLIATVAITPIGGWSAAPAFVDPVALGAGLGVGVASSVIPYVFDQLAMARLSRATYSLMVSLLPATATVIGVLVLAQVPSRVEVLGVALVVVAVAVHRERKGLAARNDEEGDRGVVAGDSGDDQRMEELVVAEDGWHRIRPAQSVDHRPGRVERTACKHEHGGRGS
jgi:inner membrane transporter RhtA